jgi:hypothetical protein
MQHEAKDMCCFRLWNYELSVFYQLRRIGTFPL